MPEADEGHETLPYVLCERISDLRYVCEAQGWDDLLYLLDIVGHELKVRLASPPQVCVDLADVPRQ